LARLARRAVELGSAFALFEPFERSLPECGQCDESRDQKDRDYHLYDAEIRGVLCNEPASDDCGYQENRTNEPIEDGHVSPQAIEEYRTSEKIAAGGERQFDARQYAAE